MRITKKAYTFDDLMLIPRMSSVPSRSLPSTKSWLFGKSPLEIPIVSAPMNTVTEHEMAITMISLGGDAVIHRYMTPEDQCYEYLKCLVMELDYMPWFAIGASGDFIARAIKLYERGVRKFCVDIANGHSNVCLTACRQLKDKFSDIYIMAGNVCTAEGARSLENAGADVIRVGIGPGSMCTTRLVTGFGVPQLTAIDDCKNALKSATIIADGGIRQSGDIVKALAMGAEAVMIGGLLAGTDETPGRTEVDTDGRLYKHYHGMASEEGRREWFDKQATSFVPEGTSTKVWHKGQASKIVKSLVGSVQVGMSFADALSIKELREHAEWVEVSENGRVEGTPNKKLFK